DLAARYAWGSTASRWSLSADASWLRLTQALTPQSPATQITGLVFNPPKFKARIGATWSNGAYEAAIYGNLQSHLRTSLGANVASEVTTDLYVARNWQHGALH